ncbi:VOC family protein [Soonwooa sp.]|uniref:VOC family protein n=1 Tax=Soonwooa sp. TaxID=1938592 RepID=UPI002603555A|nr:VOC family protein [Soonwooa sp.]
MATTNIYLTFEGNCKEAFDFYKSAFGGDFPHVGKFGDMPEVDGKKISEEDKEKIMHITLPISKETVLMGSDAGTDWGRGLTVGNNFSIAINADSKEEADNLFNALSAGGKITMPLQETFWGAYFGMFVDKFNINWMMNYDDPSKMQKH